MALKNDCKPAIFNSDQGCQFTQLNLWLGCRLEIKISWSGRKRYDKLLVERLWRIDKYEEL